uniref:Poly A polymerase head domain-containing protein n=1 Tax=Globodera rostochiensis TaxID=31243 RepID=A0A914HI06_GLORO
MLVFGRRLISTLLLTTFPAKQQQSKQLSTLVKMKLSESDAFKALFTPELKQLSSLFKESGYEIRIAGGAVRDLLMGVRPSDLDFATDATPTQMKEMFERAQIRMFNKRGEEHGTVTCRINDRENFEVTTLRVDVVCDGRRATVNFTKDWELDAFRRDLTINSLFLGLDGLIYDYTGGIDDVKQRRIVFVGDPVQRLQEDYLRILRYFRFFGRFAILGAPHEPINLEAIVRCRDGLKGVSGERLWMELHQIVVGRMAGPILRCMLSDCGLGPYLALDCNRLDEFERVSSLNAPNGNDGKLNVEPSTAISALFSNSQDVQRFQSLCKCSNAEKWLGETIVERREEASRERANPLYFRNLMLDQTFERGGWPVDLKEQIKRECVELMKYVGTGAELRAEIERWEMCAMPVKGMDLLAANVPKGPRMKSVLRHLFNLWKQSDLNLAKEELLKHVDDAEIDKLQAAGSEKNKKMSKKRKYSSSHKNQTEPAKAENA